MGSQSVDSHSLVDIHLSINMSVSSSVCWLFYFIPLHAHHSLFTCFAVVDNWVVSDVPAIVNRTIMNAFLTVSLAQVKDPSHGHRLCAACLDYSWEPCSHPSYHPCHDCWTCKVKVKAAQSCPTLCDPMDCIVHGILQARILEWVAFSFSRGSSEQPRDPTQVSHISGRFSTSQATGEALLDV